MEITKAASGSELTLTLVGRLDTTTSPQLEAQIKESLDGITSLILDFAALEYVSSAGLRVILGAQKAMNNVKGKMVVRNVCDEIREVFEITGFADILTLE